MSNNSVQNRLKSHFYNHFNVSDSTFLSAVCAQPITNPSWVSCNKQLAQEMGISADEFKSNNFLQLMSGAINSEEINSFSVAYSGHQFGVWAGQLGDGRAITLGELAVGDNNELWDIQLKGAGTTPYSRFGDGRAVLRSSIREYLCSEAMHGLGIGTTRALCLSTGETTAVREQIEPAAIVCRVARSHIRFGNFEHFHYANNPKAVKELADYLIDRHFPEWVDDPKCYYLLLQNCVLKTAKTIAQWQSVGFCHGVMNTDNMSILGDTIDYGPFGFLDNYDPEFICNHSDHQGRYSYRNQPSVALWNLNALATCFSSLLDTNEITDCLQQYENEYLHHFRSIMATKIGLLEYQSHDEQLINQLLNMLAKDKVDYTLFFRKLCKFSVSNQTVRDYFIDRDQFDSWAVDYLHRLESQQLTDKQRCKAMQQVNPLYVLRNYMAQTAIKAAEAGDFSEVELLLKILNNPYIADPLAKKYEGLPPDWASTISVSCSS
ncbi:MAG: protein adenylyltransferase SelO [Porticoccaceae bacterium]